MTNAASTDKQLHDKQHTHIQDTISDKDDDNFDEQPLLLLDLVTKLIQVLIIFLHNLFRRLKIE
jgi:hypothetical protein